MALLWNSKWLVALLLLGSHVSPAAASYRKEDGDCALASGALAKRANPGSAYNHPFYTSGDCKEACDELPGCTAAEYQHTVVSAKCELFTAKVTRGVNKKKCFLGVCVEDCPGCDCYIRAVPATTPTTPAVPPGPTPPTTPTPPPPTTPEPFVPTMTEAELRQKHACGVCHQGSAGECGHPFKLGSTDTFICAPGTPAVDMKAREFVIVCPSSAWKLCDGSTTKAPLATATATTTKAPTAACRARQYFDGTACVDCANLSCTVDGQYRTGECTAETKGFTCTDQPTCEEDHYLKGSSGYQKGICTACDFSTCPDGQYRTGKCGGKVNRYACVYCTMPDCTAGQTLSGTCTAATKAFTCVDPATTTAPPSTGTTPALETARQATPNGTPTASTRKPTRLPSVVGNSSDPPPSPVIADTGGNVSRPPSITLSNTTPASVTQAPPDGKATSTPQDTQDEPGQGGQGGAIASGVVGAVVVGCLIGLAVFLYTRRTGATPQDEGGDRGDTDGEVALGPGGQPPDQRTHYNRAPEYVAQLAAMLAAVRTTRTA